MIRRIVCIGALGAFSLGTAATLPEAAKRQDRAAVTAALQSGAEVNAAEPDGTTALHWAAYQDDRELAKLLLGKGAQVGAKNRYGVTPLTLACTSGSPEMVKLLLDAGADPNTALPGGETALMTASRAGMTGAVKLLLAKGADVHAKEARLGQTAVMWAAAEGHADTVDALVKGGADFRARVESGFNAFLFAAREGRIEVVKVLLAAGADVNDTIQRSGTNKRASQGRQWPAIGTSALLLAATNAHFDLGAYLLEKGANPNNLEAGITPLHMVTHVRKPGGGDNDPSPIGSGRMTSLEFVKKLKEHGADLNARMTKKVQLGLTGINTLGATPFFMAAKTADAELMRLLAKLGADPSITNADNSTPLMAAAGLGTRSPGEDAGTEKEVMEAIEVALALGNNIDAVDNNGETAMHGAAYKNAPGAVLLLASKGADIKVWNQPNRHGWSPLTIAQGYRFGNYKPSLVTVEAFEQVFAKAGVKPVEVAKPANRSPYN